LSADVDIDDNDYVDLNMFTIIDDDGAEEDIESDLNCELEKPDAAVLAKIREWRPKGWNCNVRGAGTSKRTLQRNNSSVIYSSS
jgi:hypothetical protein